MEFPYRNKQCEKSFLFIVTVIASILQNYSLRNVIGFSFNIPFTLTSIRKIENE